MDIEFKFPDELDILELAENISEEDRLEVLALGFNPRFALEHALEHAIEAVAIRKDGELACITGISLEDGLAGDVIPWLLSTTMMRNYRRKVLEFSTMLITRWRASHPYMENYVDARHVKAIAWLRHIGAQIHPSEPYGPYNRPFHKFTFGEK